MYQELNRILHQPIRTRIMAYLIAQGKSDYSHIKKMFNLSDGHMTTHMRELLAHNYVGMEKIFVDNKPRTTYFMTDLGRKEFAQYIQAIKHIIMFDGDQ